MCLLILYKRISAIATVDFNIHSRSRATSHSNLTKKAPMFFPKIWFWICYSLFIILRGASHFPTPLKNFATPRIFLRLHAFSNPCNSMHLRLHCDSMRLHGTPCPSRSPLFATGSDTLQRIYMCIMNRILHIIVNFLTSSDKF